MTKNKKYQILNYSDILQQHTPYLFITDKDKRKAFRLIKYLNKNFKIYFNKNWNTPIQKYQLLMFTATYPYYIILVDELVPNCFIGLIASIDIELGFIDYNTPLIKLLDSQILLTVLPLWIYIDKNILKKCAINLLLLTEKDCNYLYNYAKNINLDTISKISKKYIDLVSQNFALINTSSLLHYLDELEEYYTNLKNSQE